MEYIHLVGTEQVQNAANIMKEAAHEITNAANSMRDTFEMYKELDSDIKYRLDEMIRLLGNIDDPTSRS